MLRIKNGTRNRERSLKDAGILYLKPLDITHLGQLAVVSDAQLTRGTLVVPTGAHSLSNSLASHHAGD